MTNRKLALRNRLLKNRKGVSPTISMLLMLVITVVAMLLVISFGLNFIDTRNAQMGERLAVEKILFESSNSSIQIYVRNIGHGDLTLVESKVNDRLYTLTQGNVVISPEGRFVTIQLPSLPEGLYTISFLTSRHNELGRTEVGYS